MEWNIQIKIPIEIIYRVVLIMPTIIRWQNLYLQELVMSVIAFNNHASHKVVIQRITHSATVLPS